MYFYILSQNNSTSCFTILLPVKIILLPARVFYIYSGVDVQDRHFNRQKNILNGHDLCIDTSLSPKSILCLVHIRKDIH